MSDPYFKSSGKAGTLSQHEQFPNTADCHTLTQKTIL